MADERDFTHEAYTHPPLINPFAGERRKKRLKFFICLAAFVVYAIIVKLRTPKFRVRSAAFDSFEVVDSGANPSFNLRMVAELGLENPNFGRYKYGSTTVEFYYRDFMVGDALVPKARAGARSTRKFNITVDLSSAGVPASELSAPLSTIPLISWSTLTGKVQIMMTVVKKSVNMKCKMQIDVQSRQLRNLSCR